MLKGGILILRHNNKFYRIQAFIGSEEVLDRFYKYYLDEKTSYSWELDEGSYEPIPGKIQNKSRYHLMDAERYILSDFLPDIPYGRGAGKEVIEVTVR